MPRVALIGSCVTRDAWHFGGRLPEPLFFTARTGLVSIMSDRLPAPVDAARLSIDSDFQRGCLHHDLNKTVLPALEAFQPDTIILDFIDERFDILRIGDAFVSYSHELQLAGGLALDWAAGGRVIDRLSTEATTLWADAARRFAAHLQAHPALRHAQVVLHAAPWVQHQVAGTALLDGAPPVPTAREQQITFGKVVDVVAYDRLMRSYYDTMRRLLPAMQVVAVPPRHHVGAGGHMWGASPFHYVTSYYDALNAQLRLLGVTP